MYVQHHEPSTPLILYSPPNYYLSIYNYKTVKGTPALGSSTTGG